LKTQYFQEIVAKTYEKLIIKELAKILSRNTHFLLWLNTHYNLTIECTSPLLIPEVSEGRISFPAPSIKINIKPKRLNKLDKIKYYLEDFRMYFFGKTRD